MPPSWRKLVGKLTGKPGIVMVTRGPGATNASPGIHVASQDSTPLIMFVGQVARDMKEREAFQELDYKAVFGTMAKWVVEIDRAERIPEILSRAFHVATQGRPGPVVIALPEDMLTDLADVPDAKAFIAGSHASGRNRYGDAPAPLARGREPHRSGGWVWLERAGGCRPRDVFREFRSCLSPSLSAARCCFPPIIRISQVIWGSAPIRNFWRA